MNLQQIKQNLKEEFGEVDVFFHNTFQKNLTKGNFVYRVDSKGSNKTGLFAHMGVSDSFNSYGTTVMAVLVARTAKPVIRELDSDHVEIKEAFIEKSDIIHIEHAEDYDY